MRDMIGLVNRREHVLFAVPAVGSVADLRGKRVGINGLQGSDHRAVLDALRHGGTEAATVAFLVVGGGQNARLAAVQSGAVDAAAFQPPVTAQARSLGLRELLNVGTVVDQPTPTTAIVTSRAALAERSEVLRRFLRALARGVALYREQPAVAVRGIADFFALDPAEHAAALEDTRAHYADLYANPPAPPIEGYRLLLDEIAETVPRARDYRLADAIDERLLP